MYLILSLLITASTINNLCYTVLVLKLGHILLPSFSIAIILFYFLQGMNKNSIKQLESRGWELVKFYDEQDDDRFLVQSLDHYLALAIKAQVLDQQQLEASKQG